MPKITEMFAFIAEDTGPDDEGVAAFNVGEAWYPMVGADWDRVDILKDIAKGIALRTGKELKLVRFTTREEIEIIK